MFMETRSFQERLRLLRLAGVRLADLLLLNAEELETCGAPLASDVTVELKTFRERFADVAALLQPEDAAESLHEYDSIAKLESEVERRANAKSAIDTARSILQIEAHDQRSLAGLIQLRSEAQDVIATQGARLSTEEQQQFVEQSHVWCDLLRMVQEGDTLPDETWTALNETIETHLGQPLAIAAARGRFFWKHELSNDLANDAVTAISTEVFAMPAPATDVAEATTDPEEQNAVIPAEPTPVVSAVEEPPPAVPVAIETRGHSSENRSSVISRALSKVLATTTRLTPSSSLSQKIPVTAPPESATRGKTESVFDDDADDAPTLSIMEESASPVGNESESGRVPSVEPPSTPEMLTTDPAALEELSAVTPKSDSSIIFPPRHKPSTRLTADKSSSSIFDEDADDDERWMNRDQAKENLSASEPVFSIPDVVPSPLAEKLLAEARFQEAAGPTASLAAMILNRPEEDRSSLIPDLIFHLIHEGRPGLAYHLSRGLECRGNVQRPFIPSWLIRVWTFGRALVFPKGQLAGLIQDDLRSRHAPDVSRSSREWKQAFSLLIRGSTLRPAIIAPATHAASLLRDFDLQGGCVQLYNYCSRIGAYGERIQGVFPGLFKLSSASAPYSEQLSLLHSDIQTWKDDTATIKVRTSLSSPLFQKAGWSLRAGSCQKNSDAASEWIQWQIALRQGASIVVPILEDRRGELGRVKAEVEEISSKLASQDSSPGTQKSPASEIRSFLRQVATFAQRWISLHSVAASSDSQNYLPQPAAELRSEIQHRHEPVMQELRTLAADEASFEVRMALSCLMQSVIEIRDLVDPNVATESREADPRHLLHSELLKISGLRIGANWEPENDAHELENEILSLLCQPQPDWTIAFKMHLAQGNHQLAERILSLTIWTNDERDALQGILDQEKARVRVNFTRDLAAIKALLSESVHLDILNESERQGFETRIGRLQRMSESENEMHTGVLELDRVRELLVKRREREAERIRSRLRQLGSPVSTTTDSVPVVAESAAPRQWLMDFTP